MLLPDLPALLARSADAAERLVSEARTAVAERVAPGGRLDRKALDKGGPYNLGPKD